MAKRVSRKVPSIIAEVGIAKIMQEIHKKSGGNSDLYRRALNTLLEVTAKQVYDSYVWCSRSADINDAHAANAASRRMIESQHGIGRGGHLDPVARDAAMSMIVEDLIGSTR